MATILIAEDDHAISDLVAYNLERAGHTPLAAYDGLTALEVARRDKPELILLDQMMPGMDGHGVLRELRRDSRTQNIPVIFLTAKAQAEDRIQGLELGADDYVTKPFSPKELVLRVASVLKRCEHTPGSVIAEYGPFTFDKNALKFYIDKEEVDLTANRPSRTNGASWKLWERPSCSSVHPDTSCWLIRWPKNSFRKKSWKGAKWGPWSATRNCWGMFRKHSIRTAPSPRNSR